MRKLPQEEGLSVKPPTHAHAFIEEMCRKSVTVPHLAASAATVGFHAYIRTQATTLPGVDGMIGIAPLHGYSGRLTYDLSDAINLGIQYDRLDGLCGRMEQMITRLSTAVEGLEEMPKATDQASPRRPASRVRTSSLSDREGSIADGDSDGDHMTINPMESEDNVPDISLAEISNLIPDASNTYRYGMSSFMHVVVAKLTTLQVHWRRKQHARCEYLSKLQSMSDSECYHPDVS